MKFIPLPTECQQLEQLPNIIPSIANSLRSIGIRKPVELKDQDAYVLYSQLCNTSGKRHDPCVIEVFISAIRYMQGQAAQPWWAFTEERKKFFKSESLRSHSFGTPAHFELGM
jgi:Pathogenicity locus